MPKILKTKKQSKNQNKALLCITSVLKGLFVFLILFLIISILVYKVNDSEFYYFMVYGSIALSAFYTGFISYKKLGGRGIIIGLISSMILFSVIFLIVLFSMKFEISSKVLILLPVCVIPGIAGGILSANK